MKRILIALLLLAAPAWATSYYVDCTNGSNGGAGSFQQPWRTPLEVSVYAASTGFNPGDAIYFHRDCTWHDGIRLAWISGGQTNSGSSGSPIVLDSYGGQTLTPGTGAPPHFTGMFPIPNNQCNGGPSATKACWCQGTWSAPGNVPTCTAGPAHIWSTRPLFDANPGDNCINDGQNCIQCPSAGLSYSCFDQPITALTYVRFGTIWGNDQEVAVAGSSIAASLTQDRDWYFDTSIVDSTRQTLFVYCTCTGGVTPDVYYGTVAPIAISGEDAPFAGGPVMLNLLGVQWIQAQHLLFDWYTGIGIFIQSTAATPVADHIWIANVAANSYVENGAYRFNATGALCIWSSTPPCASNNGSGGTNVEQYNQIGLWVNNYSATGLVTPFTDIHVWNSDFMMNNLGVQVGAGGTYACSTCLVDLKNDRIYGSRTYGLRDNLGGAAQLSYSHLYGNNLATALETDVQTQWNLPALGISCSAGVVTAVFPSGNVPPFALAPGQKISVQTGGISGLTIPALAGSFTVASYSAGTLTWVQSPCPTGTYPATGGSINMVYANDRGNNLPYVSNLNLNAVTGAIDYSHMQMPWVQNWVRWTPYVMLNYDDPGLVQYSDNYVTQALPLATSRLGASHFSVATVTGGSYSGAQVNGGNANPGFVSEIQGWIGAGYDVLTHSTSHGYWKPPAASCGPGAVYEVPCHIFNLLHYTGSVASTVTLSVTHSGPTAATLTIASSPSDPALALFAAGVPLAPQYPWSGGERWLARQRIAQR